jgi:probable phosphoglycerate mutase
MTRLWLVRHGEAHVNLPAADGLLVIEDRLGLTDVGRAQAGRLRDRLAASGEVRPDAIVSSTLPRAAQTAQIVSAAFDLVVEYTDDLQEWRLGADAHPYTYEEATLAYERIASGDGIDERVSPDSETLREFAQRAGDAVLGLSQRYAGQEVLAFAHGGIIDHSFVALFGVPLQLAVGGHLHTRHTSLTLWQEVDGPVGPVWQLGRYNDAAHLEESWSRPVS